MDKNLNNRRVLLNILRLVNREQLYPILMNLTRLCYNIKNTLDLTKYSQQMFLLLSRTLHSYS